MSKRRLTAEQITGKFREAEVLQSKGEAMEMICQRLDVTEGPITIAKTSDFKVANGKIIRRE